jgi:glycerophosphoryl diester phosphodiesterase
VQSFEEMLHIFYYEAGVDGIFTDFPDRANTYLRTLEYRQLH